MKEQKWVSNLVLVRHGESTRNEERVRAKALQLESYGNDRRDMDVELTPLGRQQAQETGARLHKQLGFKFDRAFASPYRRTSDTARLMLAGQPPDLLLDERIREKEFGILDGLTKLGIRIRHEAEAKRKQQLGKYYYRPVGGESYPDVNLRVHSFIGMLVRECREQNVLVVCHSVIVLSFRRLLERLSEKELLAIDADPAQEPKNCSVTWYAYEQGKLRLKRYNDIFYDASLASYEPSRPSEVESESGTG